ncbi:MAG: hypothetical protein B6I28_02915 [Fusobacteriia bacterium 4572_132]|nr:MAG: hypothetical protein B6I28_02915 [Fusobacteriia bacterium 4572_132]
MLVIDLDLNGILKNTYGCLIFQEQVLKISQKIAGYSLAEADQKVRKNISSKNIEKINALEKEFVNSSIENGYSKEVSKRTFNYLVNFSKYGFNKPHAAIYSFVAYKTMELKIYHKNIYLNEYLKVSKKKEIKKIFDEIGDKTINLNINHSKYQTITWNEKNYLGFHLIKNFTIDDYKKILNIRPIRNINQLRNVLTNNKIENLIKSGTFDFLNENRFILLNNLFGNVIYNVDDYNFYEQIKFEKESTGINFFNDFSKLPDDIENEQLLNLRGIIDFVGISVDKNNNEYAKLKVLLNNKTTYVVIFNDKYIEYKEFIKKGYIINFEGIYNKKFNNINLKKIV